MPSFLDDAALSGAPAPLLTGRRCRRQREGHTASLVAGHLRI